MSFLNQLKSQAKALQSQQTHEQADLEQNCAHTESACRIVLPYLQDLARQLNVIGPLSRGFSLDGKTPWPVMKFIEFRVDSRRKMLRNREVFDYLAMGWRVLPEVGQPVGGSVRVNFPPDLERVVTRLAMGPVRHERKELRHPEKNTLQAIQFDYLTETRGNVMVTPDHDKATLSFRVMNASGFGIFNKTMAAQALQADVLDELAKLIVSEPNRFA